MRICGGQVDLKALADKEVKVALLLRTIHALVLDQSSVGTAQGMTYSIWHFVFLQGRCPKSTSHW
jgi:hypothetical protein